MNYVSIMTYLQKEYKFSFSIFFFIFDISKSFNGNIYKKKSDCCVFHDSKHKLQ